VFAYALFVHINKDKFKKLMKHAKKIFIIAEITRAPKFYYGNT